MTTYMYGSRKLVGTRQAPLVTASDREIEVQTALGPLLDEIAENARLRPQKSPEASAYAEGGRLFTVESLFSSSECARLIDAAEAIGFGKTSYPKSYRGNLRLITVDHSLGQAVWLRLREHVPASVDLDGDVWLACGLNECWRLAKYHPGDRFGAHCDADFVRSDGERSMYTVNIYMNTVLPEHGGATRFYDARDRHDTRPPTLAVQPEVGLGVVFRQPPGEQLLHDGEELRGGYKFLFRTDVMYRRSKDHETLRPPSNGRDVQVVEGYAR